jgi:hypothetical protein
LIRTCCFSRCGKFLKLAVCSPQRYSVYISSVVHQRLTRALNAPFEGSPPTQRGIGRCHSAQGQIDYSVTWSPDRWAALSRCGTHAAPLRSREKSCFAAAGMAGGCHGDQGCSPAAAVAQRLEASCTGAVGSWSPWGCAGPAVAGRLISRLAAKKRPGPMAGPSSREGPSPPSGLGQKLLNPDPVPLLSDEPCHRWGGLWHLEGRAKGAGEGLAVARGQGCQATSKTEPLATLKTEPPLGCSGGPLSECFRLGFGGASCCSWFP